MIPTGKKNERFRNTAGMESAQMVRKLGNTGIFVTKTWKRGQVILVLNALKK